MKELTENQIAELAEIGNQYLYLSVMEEGRISYLGIMEILKRYEELRKTDLLSTNKESKVDAEELCDAIVALDESNSRDFKKGFVKIKRRNLLDLLDQFSNSRTQTPPKLGVTDEDIINNAPYQQTNDGEESWKLIGFVRGAKWMREQLTPQDTHQDTPQDTHQVGMSAEELDNFYFNLKNEIDKVIRQEVYMDKRGLPIIQGRLKSADRIIDWIKDQDFALHSQKGLFRKVKTSERLPAESGIYDTDLGRIRFKAEHKRFGAGHHPRNPLWWLEEIT